jgi:uncharacterized protein (TIGR02466 family)
MIYDLFPTPIGVYDVSTELDFKDLYHRVKNLKVYQHDLIEGPGGSSYGSGEVIDDIGAPELFDLPNFIDVNEVCMKTIRKYCRHTGLRSNLEYTFSWFNINEKGTPTNPHRHNMSALSGALYVYAEETAQPIMFNNPTNIYRSYEMSENNSTVQGYWHTDATVQSKTGLLVIFPSWLEHLVPKGSETDNERIVISFNTKYPH